MNLWVGRRQARVWLLMLFALACLNSAGCVRRRLTLRSTPPGAAVYVDGQFIGATPVSTDFTYYGTRNIAIIKDGFETHTVKQQFLPPWYQFPGLDFINENFNPYEFRDERELHFTLEPQRIVPPDELLGRADRLRKGAITPLPQTYAPGSGDVWGDGIRSPASPTLPPANLSGEAILSDGAMPGGAGGSNWVGPQVQELGPSPGTGYSSAPNSNWVLPPPGNEAPFDLTAPPPGQSPLPAPPPVQQPASGPAREGVWPGFGPSGNRTRPAESSADRY